MIIINLSVSSKQLSTFFKPHKKCAHMRKFQNHYATKTIANKIEDDNVGSLSRNMITIGLSVSSKILRMNSMTLWLAHCSVKMAFPCSSAMEAFNL